MPFLVNCNLYQVDVNSSYQIIMKKQFFNEDVWARPQIFCNVHIDNLVVDHNLYIILLLLTHFHTYDKSLFAFVFQILGSYLMIRKLA